MGVSIREVKAQNLHDYVVNTAATRLDRAKYDVYTNPGTQKNIVIGGQYPDVVVTPKGVNTVQFVIEVETQDSVNDSEAVGQWKPYSELGSTFYLLVPHVSLQIAQNLCLRNGIQAKFAVYWTDERGNLQIKYY